MRSQVIKDKIRQIRFVKPLNFQSFDRIYMVERAKYKTKKLDRQHLTRNTKRQTVDIVKTMKEN